MNFKFFARVNSILLKRAHHVISASLLNKIFTYRRFCHSLPVSNHLKCWSPDDHFALAFHIFQFLAALILNYSFALIFHLKFWFVRPHIEEAVRKPVRKLENEWEGVLALSCSTWWEIKDHCVVIHKHVLAWTFNGKSFFALVCNKLSFFDSIEDESQMTSWIVIFQKQMHCSVDFLANNLSGFS